MSKTRSRSTKERNCALGEVQPGHAGRDSQGSNCGQLTPTPVNQNSTCALGAIHRLQEFTAMCRITAFLFSSASCLTQPNDVPHAEAFIALFLLSFFSSCFSPQISLSTLCIFSSPFTQFAPFALWIVPGCLTSDYFHCPLYNLAFHIVFSTPVHTHFKH